MPFIPNTDEDRKEMLKNIGVKSVDELLSPIPPNFRLKKDLDLPSPLSELEVKKLMGSISNENVTTEDCISFLGAGAYDHYIPSMVNYVISRPEFYTAYTPYQAEASQGTLQTIYEYQSMVSELMSMDCSNASMYDGGSALAEACHMAISIKNRKKILIPDSVNPSYIACCETYLGKSQISNLKSQNHPQIEHIPVKDGLVDIDALRKMMNEEVSAVVVQHPNFFGLLEEVDEIEKIVHNAGALYITVPFPISLGVLKPPGDYGVDIVACEGQSLGIPQSFGGPYLGILATRREFMRKMPGRIIGKTVDTEGKRGFVMTLQTREQHIRREKATSNICTNEGLCAIAGCVYLTVMGKQGIREVGELCLQKAHYLAEKIGELDRFELLYNTPFFNEFVIKTPIPAEDIKDKLLKDKVFAGVVVDKNALLIAVTEKRTREEMDYFVERLKRMVGV